MWWCLANPQHSCDDLNGTSSHCCVLDMRFLDSCVSKYFIGVEPDLKNSEQKFMIMMNMSHYRQTHTHNERLSCCPGSQKPLLIRCFHMIDHSDYCHHQGNHHSCIWDLAFHQYGLLTSAPLEINLRILINHTLLMQHPSLMRCG